MAGLLLETALHHREGEKRAEVIKTTHCSILCL